MEELYIYLTSSFVFDYSSSWADNSCSEHIIRSE